MKQRPPIVGVFAFAAWLLGPSWRINCEICLDLSHLIYNGYAPRHKNIAAMQIQRSGKSGFSDKVVRFKP